MVPGILSMKASVAVLLLHLPKPVSQQEVADVLPRNICISGVTNQPQFHIPRSFDNQQADQESL